MRRLRMMIAADTASQRSMQASRRQVLAGLGGFIIALGMGGRLAHAAAIEKDAGFVPNVFIRVAHDGHVKVISSYLEMGQGTFTGLATMAAEELDVGIDQVTVEAAPADLAYANPKFGIQGTGGSTAMAGAWDKMRPAAATARAMLLTAAGKRWRVPVEQLTVERGVVHHVASGRSAGYGDFVDAAMRMAVPTTVEVKKPDQYRLLGRPGTRRIDVAAKVDGSAIYTQDQKLPDMLVAVMAHPPKLWGKVAAVDAEAALAVPGVVAVVEVPGDDDVQGGVAVLARNTWVAMRGRDALNIRWDGTKAPRIDTAEMAKRFEDLSKTPGRVALTRGKILTDRPSGGTTIEAIYHQPFLAHAPMEPMNCLVHIEGDRCTIWNGEQNHTIDQVNAAKELGIPTDHVAINQLYAGGSFGRRANPRSDFVREAVRIAREARKKGIGVPIKMVWMREDDMRMTQYRPQTVHNAVIQLDGDGKIASWHHRIVGASFTKVTAPDGIDHMLLEGIEDMPYAIPNLRLEQHNPEDTYVPTQWLRSVGHTHSAFVGETLIDEAARAAKADPYQYRRAMLLKGDPRQLGVLDLVAQRSGWGRPLAEGADGTRRARGIALQQAFGTYVAQVVEVSLHQDGSYAVDRVYCSVDCGTVINPDIVMAQIEGGTGFGLSFLRQAITIKDGAVQQGNFNDYPVLRMDAMPPVEVSIIPSTAKPTGVGEPGVPLIAPAVVNAIASLTGKSIHALPLPAEIEL
ncbi:aldehyde oxidase [Sphingobium lactosutens]|uniref:xanthine dehydrogenase family protein molybdopterin-binding subunit n=1 Tax=Sphingobium lactosutens TaxID=522773 RepID=UPI0015C19283|nr:xanthine dehydrogenase family protein molybdopterin-binding subunit [Sphingobium lactosutens]NWK98411.1 aldehyde oxidase [Sphingobium lactosutens]